jgi:signal transduction histidine kinase/HAMP domain-containing protein
VLDWTGKIIAATQPGVVGIDRSSRSYVQQALAGSEVASGVYVSMAPAGQTPNIAFAAPVRGSSGEVVGAFVIWLEASAIWEVMRAANDTAGPGSFFVLFDRYGVRVGHSRNQKLLFHPGAPVPEAAARAMLAERRFQDRTAELLGAVVPFPLEEIERSETAVFRRAYSPTNLVPNLAASRKYPALGWTLVAHTPESNIEVPLVGVLERFLPALAIGLLLAGLGGVLLLRQVVRPVRALADAAVALERGDLDLDQFEAIAPGSRLPDEIDQLTRALRSMARTLAERARSVRTTNQDLRQVLDNVGQGFLATDPGGFIRPERSAVMDQWFGPPGASETVWTYLGGGDATLTSRIEQAWPAVTGDARARAAGLAALPHRLGRGRQTFDLVYRLVERHGRIERVILVVTDVSSVLEQASLEQKLEAELRQAQKLEAVGRLASGIAHEINTPVQFVSDSCRFLQEATRSVERVVATYQKELVPAAVATGLAGPALQAVARAESEADLPYLMENMPQAADLAMEGLQRVATIVRALKEFAHPDTKEMAPVDLNHAIESTLTIARNEYKYVAEVVTDLAPLPDITCHASEVNQAVLNIVVNAAHAIGDVVKGTDQKGTITLRTRVEGELVHLTIQDTGGGIPQAIQDKIFDPFFTTKEVGKGTGQGLWIARSIVCEKHGGELAFETEAGRGTTFHIRLPVDGKRPARAPAPTPAPQATVSALPAGAGP